MNSAIRSLGSHTCATARISFSLMAIGGCVSLQLRGRGGAAHLDAERIAADRLGAAGELAPAARLLLAPGVHSLLGLARRVEPDAGPDGAEHKHQDQRRGDQPRPPARFQFRHGRSSVCLGGRLWPHQGAVLTSGRAALHAGLRAVRRAVPVTLQLSMDPDIAAFDRRPVGVRLWLPDLAAGLRIRRAGPGAPDRRPSGAVRVLARASRHAGAARAGARARFRRRLPRGRLSGGGEAARRDGRLSARARAGDQRLPRDRALRHPARPSRSGASTRWST